MISQERTHTVLVVEDEKQLAFAVTEALHAHGFTVYNATSLNTAIEQLTTLGTVDVIWLDHYLMGAGNGIDFVVKLKSDPKWSQIPVFIVSNTASTQNVHSYIQLGVTNYYTKADYDIGQIISDIKYTLTQDASLTHTI